jgi:predicted secreted protein
MAWVGWLPGPGASLRYSKQQARPRAPAGPAFLFVACNGYGDVSKAVNLTELDSGSSVTVKVTQVLIITLRGNHSTPFHSVLTQEPDPNVLESLGSDYDSEGDAPGAGGHEIWRFRAVGEGSANILLTYESLDGSGTPGDRFSLSVRVEQAG